LLELNYLKEVEVVQDVTGINLLMVSCRYYPPNVRVANGVGPLVGSADPPEVKWFATRK